MADWINNYLPVIDDSAPGLVAGNSFWIYVNYPVAIPTEVGIIVKITSPVTGQYLLVNNLKYKTASKVEGYLARYAIEINAEDFKTELGSIEAGETYQCAVKMLQADSNLENVADIEKWITNNPNSSSPWSAAVLFNIIDQPNIVLDQAIIPLEGTGAQIYGTFSAAYDDLQWYQITKGNQTTDRIYPKQKNVIEYVLPNAAVGAYTLTYKTKKGFLSSIAGTIIQETIKRIVDFRTEEEGGKLSISQLNVDDNFDLGLIDVSFQAVNGRAENHNVVIKLERASHKTGFTSWERIETIETTLNAKTTQSFAFKDLFIEAGTIYLYRVWMEWDEGTILYTSSILFSSQCIATFEDIYLAANGLQLRVLYNPDIQQLKYNLSDTVTATIGGKYPIVRRNGNQKYTTFTIGGLISYHAEEDSALFFTPEEVGDYYDSLDFNFKEVILEKAFRDKVNDFLLADDIKLFKSLPEGTKIVKLINVSFTPNKTLGRNIYSFSAQAVEVMDCTLENYSKYVVQNKR